MGEGGNFASLYALLNVMFAVKTSDSFSGTLDVLEVVTLASIYAL